jgi:hypothetical protein
MGVSGCGCLGDAHAREELLEAYEVQFPGDAQKRLTTETLRKLVDSRIRG